ncbi:MAG: PD-(D/E)XK nuclease family protein [Miltoncostaeaceae bacterium]
MRPEPAAVVASSVAAGRRRRPVRRARTAGQDDDRQRREDRGGEGVTGRADVILDHEGGVQTSLALLDYKTSTSGDATDHALQLQIYSDAGRREGLDVRAAYVHDLKASDRLVADVSDTAIEASERTVVDAAARLRSRDYAPNPSKARCAACEVRTVCGSRHT